MNHSDSIVNLAGAIVKAQSEISAVMENKQNPFLKSTYADLGAVIEAIRPSFEKYGLAVVQFPFGENGEIGVETILVHSSGEWISERASMSASEEKGKTDAQVAGSIISYLRRYGISSVARIYTEDNDGQTGRASGQQERAQSRVSVPAGSGNATTSSGGYARETQATPEKSVPAPANSDKGTKENSQITPTAKPKKIETATCPVHLTTTILWESNGIKKWYHKTEDGQECYAIPEKAKGA